jgi:hypothetical protein
LILEKKSDPAVLVDIPKTPGADEIEKGRNLWNTESTWSMIMRPGVTSSYGN